MLFAVWARDAAGKRAAREQVRDRHRARLREPGSHAVKVLLAGPTFDDDGVAMNGTMLVVEADAIETVRAFVAADPYVEAGVYESFDVRPWRCGIGPLTRGV